MEWFEPNNLKKCYRNKNSFREMSFVTTLVSSLKDLFSSQEVKGTETVQCRTRDRSVS